MITGRWKNGKRHGDIVVTFANGREEYRTYDMGKILTKEEVYSDGGTDEDSEESEEFYM